MFETELYERTLSDTSAALHRADVDRLRTSLLECRQRSGKLGTFVGKDHPSFTVHDVTHADALWEMADLIAGNGYPVNPMEAFVFGCAALIHDLAMTKASLPGDFADVVGAERWRDALFANFRHQHGSAPTAAELADPPEAVIEAARRELLRDHHGEHAARLPHQRYADAEGGDGYFLIPDVVLRNTYGELIGRIAASHWWPTQRLPVEFNTAIGAPGTLPKGWTVDPLKIACLLRASDVAHLDNRRAPGFLRAVSDIDASSRPYWIFQERLQRPWLDSDRLMYTASPPFEPENAPAWWLCVDALRATDDELRACDTVLADAGRPRFVARSVGYVDDLPRLAQAIAVRDWYPIDAKVRVGNVIDLVRKLGDRELYGDHPEVALRELISNGLDAVRARRALQGDAGELRLRVHVELGPATPEGRWLTVRDNGIGMTREILGGPLLDFGTSYWSSADARRDLPGLMSSGFSPSGRFGIGFFAVFMLGTHIRVTSRRFDQAATDTHVLEFHHGIDSRPLLRRATGTTVVYGGTEVSILLTDTVANALLEDQESLHALCRYLFPAADTDIDVLTPGDRRPTSIPGNFWATAPPDQLLTILYPGVSVQDPTAVHRMSDITGRDGELLGRAAIMCTNPYALLPTHGAQGIVTVDGARTTSSLTNVVGLVKGRATRATRDSAEPLAEHQALLPWVAGQVELFLRDHADSLDAATQVQFTQNAYLLGAELADLPVALCRDGPLRPDEVIEWARSRDRALLVPLSKYLNRRGPLTRPPQRIDEDVLLSPIESADPLLAVRQSSSVIEPLLFFVNYLIAQAWDSDGPNQLALGMTRGTDDRDWGTLADGSRVGNDVVFLLERGREQANKASAGGGTGE